MTIFFTYYFVIVSLMPKTHVINKIPQEQLLTIPRAAAWVAPAAIKFGQRRGIPQIPS